MTARQAANPEVRSWVHDLTATRNRLAHAGWEGMPDEDAWRGRDSVIRLPDQWTTA